MSVCLSVSLSLCSVLYVVRSPRPPPHSLRATPRSDGRVGAAKIRPEDNDVLLERIRMELNPIQSLQDQYLNDLDDLADRCSAPAGPHLRRQPPAHTARVPSRVRARAAQARSPASAGHARPTLCRARWTSGCRALILAPAPSRPRPRPPARSVASDHGSDGDDNDEEMDEDKEFDEVPAPRPGPLPVPSRACSRMRTTSPARAVPLKRARSLGAGGGRDVGDKGPRQADTPLRSRA